MSHPVAKRPAHPPTTVAGAGGALTALTARDLQAGRLDQHAAQAILGQLQGVLTAYDHGQLDDALRHAADLGNQVTILGSHGDIKPSAMPGVSGAIANLRSVLERAAPPPAPEAPAPRHGPKPGHDHGKAHGD